VFFYGQTLKLWKLNLKVKRKRRPYLPPTTVPLPSARAQLKDRPIGAGLHCNWHTSMLITAMITLHYNSYLKPLFAHFWFFSFFSFFLVTLLWTKTGNSNNINGTIAWFLAGFLMILSVLGGNVALLLFSFWACVWTFSFHSHILCSLFYVMCPGIEVNLAFALQVLY